MVYTMELVLVMLAVVGCLAQDISFPDNEKSGEEDSDNRVGGGPFFGRPRPGGNDFVRPNSGFQPGRFPQNSNNQGFNPNGQRPQNFNQDFNSNSQFPQNSNQGFNSNGQRPQNSNQGFNSNSQFPQNPNQGFNSNGQRPQNSNQGFNFNGHRPQNSNQGFNPDDSFSQNSNQGFNPDSGFGSAPSAPAQTTPGSLRPPPRSSQKIISIVPCSCPYTPEYSPVCGSDSQTYLNAALLNCFRVCGFDVTVARGAACGQTAGRTT